jgi:hypothetical protein
MTKTAARDNGGNAPQGGTGFVKVPDSIRAKLREIGPHGSLVYLALVTDADGDGKRWASFTTLRRDTGLALATLVKAIEALAKAGMMRVDRTRGRSNRYTLAPYGGYSPDEVVQPEGCSGDEVVPLSEVVLPEPLSTPEFKRAWAEWLDYRRERKRSSGPKSLTRQLAKLAAWGPAKAVEAIDTSITRGWTGLFEPRANDNERKPKIGPGQRHHEPGDRYGQPGTF